MPQELVQTTVTETPTAPDAASQSKADNGPGFDSWEQELDGNSTPSTQRTREELTSSDGEAVRATEDASPATRRAGSDGAGEKDAALAKDNTNEAKKLESSKEQESTEVNSVKAPTPSPQTKAPTDTQRLSAGRSYEGLTEQEANVFKKMGNEAYNMLLPIFKEHKQIKQTLTLKDQEIQNLKSGKEQLPPSYYEHPDAYQLTNSYREGVQLVQGANVIYNHWRQQLAKIESGEDWQTLNIDDKGNMSLGQAQPVTPDAKATIYENLAFAREQAQRVQQDLQKVKEQFVQGHSKISEFVRRDMEDAYFPFYKQEALNQPHMAEHKKAIDAVIAAMPDELRGNMLAQPLAKAFAFVIHMNKQNEELKKKLEIHDVKVTDRAKSQPTRNDTVAATSVKEGPSMVDFESMMND